MHIGKVLDSFRKSGIVLSKEKYCWIQSELPYLGAQIENNKSLLSHERTTETTYTRRPENKKEHQSFLDWQIIIQGLRQDYRRLANHSMKYYART
ncbi:hypothetical protein GJ496_003510 [Pomphorhynchus laevis]|nr:hypothetical protein GJ496_003510 [Pomphorhynchus laevis]